MTTNNSRPKADSKSSNVSRIWRGIKEFVFSLFGPDPLADSRMTRQG